MLEAIFFYDDECDMVQIDTDLRYATGLVTNDQEYRVQYITHNYIYVVGTQLSEVFNTAISLLKIYYNIPLGRIEKNA